ncbi:cupin domain-containing protein [Pararhodobacter sp. SW119]|uniref:cupin domain-containing protein n=1 Tax=Pararhodobacter sp. SW119 TaxID=2780075 RepID=UPI001AE02735|nr:cupin domain-containing protein [Pararhodobacter sp. SW119]
MTAPVSRTYDVFGLLLKFRVLPEEVAGKFCLVEAVVPPGLGAPMNAHPGESECFHVLEGQFDFTIDGATRRAGAGEIVVVPEGAAHAFACTGAVPGRLAIINAPGRMHVDFFTGVGRPLDDTVEAPQPPAGPPDMARVMQVAQAVGMTLLPPKVEVA